MSEFLAFTIAGIVTGAIYAIASAGLVITYTTSGVFNIAHGAVGMVAAFLYWQLRFGWNVPAPIAFIAVVFVASPAIGMAAERVLLRRVPRSAVSVWLVVTIGLTVGLMGLATQIWKGSISRAMPGFYGSAGVRIGGVVVTWQQISTLVAALAVAALLRQLLHRARLGLAMRAVVDNRRLLSLDGVPPGRVESLSWALGGGLAGLAGVLIAPSLQLNAQLLTLLVINAYAAAAVGRLRNLPATVAGSMALGLVQSYLVAYLPGSSSYIVEGLRFSVPTVLLFAALLAFPVRRLREGWSAQSGAARRVPGLRGSLMAGAVFVAVVSAVAGMLSGGNLVRLELGIATGLILLSLVPLAGYGGQISLCQMTFAGMGAFAVSRIGHGENPLGLLAGAALAAAVGVLVALPAVRLYGLYLALGTMAFAVMADNMFFGNPHIFGFGGAVPLRRLHLLGLRFDGDRSFTVLLAVVFALGAVGVLALRRSAFGRSLVAMRDSTLACTALGINTTRLKLAVFALSALMAGLAGGLYAEARTVASVNDYAMFQSLPILLVLVVQGVDTVSGALAGGVGLSLLGALQAAVPQLSNVTYLGTGLAGIGLGRYPEGVLVGMAQQVREQLGRVAATAAPPPARNGSGPGPAPSPPRTVPRERPSAGVELAGSRAARG